jgi:hypothetical protein
MRIPPIIIVPAAVMLLLVAAACTPAHPHAAARPSPSAAPTASVAPTATGPAGLDTFFGGDLERQGFGSFGFSDATVQDATVLPSGDSRTHTMLRVRYPADSASQLAASTSDTEHGGMQVYLAWRRGPVDEAYLRYFVRFPAGFDFVKGGKLPGLYGDRVTSGRRIPDGTDGFSTRYMWRTAGAGEVYAYLPTSVAHGTSLGRGSWDWPTGAWTEVQQHVRLNTPGQSDGLVQVWLNGTRVLDQTGLLFRTTSTLRIDGLFFSTFFGGGDASWATPTDQYADFAGFTLASSFIPTTNQ